jgi:hypothetical protein
MNAGSKPTTRHQTEMHPFKEGAFQFFGKRGIIAPEQPILTQRRFAGPGMHWSRVGAERLFPVRSAIMSSRFDERWRQAYNSPPN